MPLQAEHLAQEMERHTEAGAEALAVELADFLIIQF